MKIQNLLKDRLGLNHFKKVPSTNLYASLSFFICHAVSWRRSFMHMNMTYRWIEKVESRNSVRRKTGRRSIQRYFYRGGLFHMVFYCCGIFQLWIFQIKNSKSILSKLCVWNSIFTTFAHSMTLHLYIFIESVKHIFPSLSDSHGALVSHISHIYIFYLVLYFN